ncbi:Fe-S cluster assembly protein SufD [Marinoscillum sp. MHG1-6]|uniref:Fe-S cluster assembly protein SufD n=1 Tax=Marinoscillum sp. MHG1-6 TaxID=2959627 RepID=UPI002157B6A4|nr:Fe-S cluster assembly protein SufD [Marinoscillum sp. MHG1-6]
MAELTLTDQFTTIFEAKTGSKEGLSDFQKGSFEAFNTLGLPHRKSEAYKYTQIARILEKNFSEVSVPLETSWDIAEIKERFYPVNEANHLVFINGVWKSDLSEIKSDANHLQISVISESELDLLGKVSNSSRDPFAQLNGAQFSGGLFFKAARNSDNIPTFIYHFLDAENTSISFPRILIDAETGSQTRVYEKTFVNGDAAALVIGMLESKVESNASVRFTKLQQYPKNVYAVEGIYASQDKDSRFHTNTFTFGGAVIRNNVVIDIDGENCEGHMNGLYVISGNTQVDNNTAVDHKQPHSFSNELYKGVIDENARGVFNGKIYVRPEAQKTNAFQSNNNIILSDSATVNTKPQLEIWADDVKCSHGCTTGQLDEDAIFYLRARGISKVRAKALMLTAFAVETLEEVKEELVKDEIESIILNKLG